jgi:hypothetical protein
VRLRARKGQIMVLVVLLVPVLVGAAGLALDTSNLLTHRDAAQNAADLAALSATIDLPGAPASARATALRLAKANKHQDNTAGVGVFVTTPYLSDSTQVEVRINDTVNIMFMRLFGFRKLVVSARAVATSGKPLDAVYSGGGCGGGLGGMTWNATGTSITGAIHSNSTLTMTTSGSTIRGPIEYVCPPGNVSSTGGTVPAPTQTGARSSGLGVAYPDLQSACSGSNGLINFAGNLTITATTPNIWASPGHLKNGLICATGSISMSITATGNVTFVAGTTFSISGAGSSYSGFQNNVLAYANGTGTSFMVGAGGTWSGIIAAPSGSLNVQSSGTWVVNGSMQGAQISVNGSGLTINSSALIALKPALIQ